jgi:hypothetical protein
MPTLPTGLIAITGGKFAAQSNKINEFGEIALFMD